MANLKKKFSMIAAAAALATTGVAAQGVTAPTAEAATKPKPNVNFHQVAYWQITYYNQYQSDAYTFRQARTNLATAKKLYSKSKTKANKNNVDAWTKLYNRYNIAQNASYNMYRQVLALSKKKVQYFDNNSKYFERYQTRRNCGIYATSLLNTDYRTGKKYGRENCAAVGVNILKLA